MGEVFPPDFRRVHLELLGGHVHDALDHISGFRTACTAIGIRRHFVGEHANKCELESRHFVTARREQSGQRRNHRREQRVEGAEIGNGFYPHAKDRAVVFQRELDIVDLIAPVNRSGDILAAAFDPFHRTACFFGQVTDKSVLGIHIDFGTEPPTYFGCDHARPVFRNVQHNGKLRSQKMRDLRGRPDDEFVIRHLVGGDYAAWLHGKRSEALVDKALFHDHIGFLERFFGVSALESEVKSDVV